MNKTISESALLEKLKKTYNLDQYEKLLKAFNFAKKAHEGQKRVSGEDYFIHPCMVADILIDLGMDYNTIIAALLHDVLEDTKVTRDEMEKEFGTTVVELVDGVTKLDRIQFTSKEEEQAENLRKMLLAMAKDIRVIIIKLADRLHNMRSLSYLPEERQKAIAKETLDIYAPLAARLGISNIKCELEDLTMRYLHPEDYYALVDLISVKRKERQQFIDRVCHELQDKLKEIEVEGEVNGRPKHFYSIYKKMKGKDLNFDQIYDLFALRVIVNTVKDCYAVLGAIHTMYKPIPRRFKDYIATPKPNLYQSLHTTVMTPYGTPVEIQIRTYEMHRTAEYGIAAHWKYKEGNTLTSKDMDEKIRWLREVLEFQGEVKDSGDFLNSVKIDVFNDEVFVFTPKGDVINLPIGSNIIDFAYSIHSKIGDKCVGGKINSKMVPINTKLKTGDIVEVVTSNSAKGPSRDWLNIVKTSAAKAKIRNFFKKEMKEENIKIGKDMLDRECKKRGFNPSDLYTEKAFEALSQRYSLPSMDDVFASIGFGGVTTNQVILKLIENYNANHLNVAPALHSVADVKIESEQQKSPKNSQNSSNVLIKGYDGFLIRMSKCCNPVPKDAIIGYISRGRGVTIHRKDCPNVVNFEKDRLIDAEWAGAISDTFVCTISIYAENRGGLIAELSVLLSNRNIPINMINAKVLKDGFANIIVSIELKDIEELDALIKKISQMKGVIEVVRN